MAIIYSWWRLIQKHRKTYFSNASRFELFKTRKFLQLCRIHLKHLCLDMSAFQTITLYLQEPWTYWIMKAAQINRNIWSALNINLSFSARERIRQNFGTSNFYAFHSTLPTVLGAITRIMSSNLDTSCLLKLGDECIIKSCVAKQLLLIACYMVLFIPVYH